MLPPRRENITMAQRPRPTIRASRGVRPIRSFVRKFVNIVFLPSLAFSQFTKHARDIVVAASLCLIKRCGNRPGGTNVVRGESPVQNDRHDMAFWTVGPVEDGGNNMEVFGVGGA